MRKQFVGPHFTMGELQSFGVVSCKLQVASGTLSGERGAGSNSWPGAWGCSSWLSCLAEMRNVLGNPNMMHGSFVCSTVSIDVAALVATSNRNSNGCNPQLPTSNCQPATSKRSFLKTDSLNAIFV